MAPPTEPPNAYTRNQQEAAMIRVVLEARGWKVSKIEETATELILIATRPSAPPHVEAGPLSTL